MMVWQHMVHFCMRSGSEHHSQISTKVHTYVAYLGYTNEILFDVSWCIMSHQ